MELDQEQRKMVEDLEEKLKSDQQTMVDLKQQEYEKIRALNAKHQFELVAMEQKLEQALATKHKLQSEQAKKIRDIGRDKDAERDDVERELHRSITELDTIKQKALQRQVESRQDHE